MAAETFVEALKTFMEPNWDLLGLVGKHVVYTYSNGWEYEVYYKNEDTIDYRVRSGLVGGRMVKGQKVNMKGLRAPTKEVQDSTTSINQHLYMVSWTEPTGTCVSQVVDLDNREVTTAIFFPKWVIDDPSKTVCFQNDHLSLMLSYRDGGPTHPVELSHLYGRIHLVEDCQANNDQVIS
ncbi:hypothetical protein GOP47_0010904 [Adiantum capillus-veneris]|uniref:Phenolic acid decarboxylase n=1 Tax=Adiantum capillus-veneris TaxID=13818 RepID=A0A9D4UWR3_ADICA|nr:hypothetical protein GOP47_0010904 [Adiantum capillus-veneris]